MAITRVFLDWSRPCLQSASEYFTSRFMQPSGDFDMRGVSVALPGGRAERRVMELLVSEAEKNDAILIPPQRRTIGSIPELLYTPNLPFADELTRKIFWIQAIHSLPQEQLNTLLPKRLLNQGFLNVLSLADQAESLWVELAGSGLTFESVLEHGSKCFDFFDTEKWEILSRLQQTHQRLLESSGLSDRYYERMNALRNNSLSLEEELFIVASPDLRPMTCQMLRALERQVTILIHAPESENDSFDDLGCLKVEQWVSRCIPIDEEQIRIGVDPADQAQLIVDILGERTTKCSTEELSIGVSHEPLIPYIELQLEAREISIRPAAGKALLQTAPATLLSAISHYLAQRTFSNFASLLRHPDFIHWCSDADNEQDYLSLLDGYHSMHLPESWDYALLKSKHPKLLSLVEKVEELLRPFTDISRPLPEWTETLMALTQELYGALPCEALTLSDKNSAECCRAIVQILSEFKSLPQTASLELGGTQVLELISQALTKKHIPSEAEGNAVEVLGWLELHLDDAPNLIILGMNEGHVPQSLNADPFLPNGLRTSLGLLNNEQRYSRDSYALSAILNSRPTTQIIAGRRSSEGESLMLSRLLLADKEEKVLRRIQRYYGSDSISPAKALLPDSKEKSSFLIGEIPRPAPLGKAIEKMSVTSFRDYLRCPYRFYLRHVLRLRSLDDQAVEMDGALFGTLAHEILQRFAEKQIGVPPFDRNTLSNHLDTILQQTLKGYFGRNALPAVRVQAEQLRARFQSFIDWQTEWSEKGWRIIHSELRFDERSSSLPLKKGKCMGLRGTIDRIDFNEKEKSWAIFDYKTGEITRKPKEIHGPQEDTWFDLQLPLYYELLNTMKLEGTLQLGYLNLSRDEEVSAHMADWTEEELEDAKQTAISIAQDVRDEIFWPPSPEAFRYDDFADICGTGFFRDASSDEEGPE